MGRVISIRLSDEEVEKLECLAMGKSISEGIRSLIFEKSECEKKEASEFIEKLRLIAGDVEYLKENLSGIKDLLACQIKIIENGGDEDLEMIKNILYTFGQTSGQMLGALNKEQKEWFKKK